MSYRMPRGDRDTRRTRTAHNCISHTTMPTKEVHLLSDAAFHGMFKASTVPNLKVPRVSAPKSTAMHLVKTLDALLPLSTSRRFPSTSRM